MDYDAAFSRWGLLLKPTRMMSPPGTYFMTFLTWQKRSIAARPPTLDSSSTSEPQRLNSLLKNSVQPPQGLKSRRRLAVSLARLKSCPSPFRARRLQAPIC